MTLFQFSGDDLTVTHAGQTITLLPKEHALLWFLYENRGRSFTREELLDRVWPLEAPVDRTVDDHVYRLRKKLRTWASVLTLDTIRNHGYRLQLHETKRAENPSLLDSDFAAKFHTMIAKYHLYGQGEALRMLHEQQKVLGVQMDPFYAVYVRFISGEFEWLICTEDVPFWQKAYPLFCVYFNICDDTEHAYDLMGHFLATGKLSFAQQWEMEHLDRAFLCLSTKRYEEAVAILDNTLAIVEADNLHGFHIAILNTQIFAFLVTERVAEAKAKIDEVAGLIEQAPYLRERGTFAIAKGLYELAHGDKRAGKASILDGLDIYRQSKFVPQYFHAVRMLRETLQALSIGADLLKTCETMWQELSRHYDFPLLQKKLRALLEAELL